MSNSGGFAVTRTRGSDRFYNPPAMRRLQRRTEDERVDSDESVTLSSSRVGSVCSASSSEQPESFTNLDRLMESVTPLVSVQCVSEVRKWGRKAREADRQPFFSLGDLWESYKEWSVYGVGVPLLLNGNNSVNQYYVPSLSGIQVYVDPKRLRNPGEANKAESSRESSSAGSSDCEADRRAEGFLDGKCVQHNLNTNSKKMNKLSISDKPPTSSSSDETEICNSNREPVFEYLEQEQPRHRQPLFDKVSNLLSQFPELSLYKSCDLLPASWISVAWYPIYRIPTGQTLQNLDASFLTFHCLSTQSKSKGQLQQQLHGMKSRGGDASSKMSLPVFGLASYKLRGSIVTPCGSNESQQANTLMQAADDWLRRLEVNLPDFQFFASHSPIWR